MKPRIAIIIVTHNAARYLEDCLSSVYANDYPHDRFEVMVVDNASSDETVSMISHDWPEVVIIQSEGNSGFAQANNSAISRALDQGFEAVFLLNQDTTVDAHFLSLALTSLEADPAIGAVQSKLLLHDQPNLINSWGNELHFLGFGYAGGYRQPDSGINHDYDITYPSGAAVLIRSTALQDIGLLRGEFFMYHEDSDLGWRLWLAGWRVCLSANSIVYHKYEFSRSITKYYFMERNRRWMILSNFHWATLLLISPALVAMDIGMLLYAIRSGWRPQYLRAWSDAYAPQAWPLVRHWRRQVQQSRRVSERFVVSRFTGLIKFQEVDNLIVRWIMNPCLDLYWRCVRFFIFW